MTDRPGKTKSTESAVKSDHGRLLTDRRSYLKTSGAVASAPFLLGNPEIVSSVRGRKSGTVTQETSGSFANPGTEAQTKFRWMVPGAYAESEELESELENVSDAGYGGTEVTLSSIPDPQSQGLGSDAWSNRLQTILAKGNDLGLEIDLHICGINGRTLSSSTIGPDEAGASKELVHGEATVSSGETYNGNVPEPEAEVGEYSQVPFGQTILADEVTEQELIAVQGARIHEENDPEATTTLLDPDSIQDVTDSVEDGSINWTAPDTGDEWLLLGFWQRGTGIAVTGMGPGQFFKIDFYSEAGTQEFINLYEDRVFSDQIRSLLTDVDGDFFKDSYGADDMWTPNLLSEFEERRGYSLRPYLAGILQYYTTWPGNGVPNTEPMFDFPDGLGEDIRNDHKQTLSDLYAEYHIKQMNEWAATYDFDYRGQVGYTEIVDPQQAAAAIDVPETESLYYSGNADGYRAQSGAAHVAGRNEYSTEVAPVNGLAYAQTWKDLLSRINNNYIGGVNRTVLHVFNYRDTPGSSWPGFSGFGHGFSTALSDRVPRWQHASIGAQYLSRTQHTLLSGTPNRDIAVYQHTYTLPAAGQGDGEGTPIDIDPLPYWDDERLRRRGYTYDYVGPKLLEPSMVSYEDGQLGPDGPGYNAFVFNSDIGPGVWPSTTSMPLETAERLLEFAQDGFPIVIVGDAPDQVPGRPESEESESLRSVIDDLLNESTVRQVESEAEVPAVLDELQVQPAAEPATPSPMATAHRSTEAAEFYFLYNKSSEPIATDLTLRGRGDVSSQSDRLYRLDPWSGEIDPIAQYQFDDDRAIVGVDLAPEETEIIAIAGQEWQDGIETPGAQVTETDGDAVIIEDGTLKLRASESGTYSAILSDGRTVDAEIGSVPASHQLEDWQLSVESWEPTEAARDAEGGPEATQTQTRSIEVELSGLRPWPEIEDLTDVSGVGTYETTIELSQDWSDDYGAILDLGEVFDTFRVRVNDEEVPTPDQIAATVDVSEYLQSGSNTIEVEVVTTLRNRLRTLVEAQSERDRQSYGLHGPVELRPYREASIHSAADQQTDSPTQTPGTETTEDTGPGFTVGATVLSLLGIGWLSQRIKNRDET